MAACQTSLHSQGNGKDQPFIALSLSLGIYRPLVKPAFYSIKLGFFWPHGSWREIFDCLYYEACPRLPLHKWLCLLGKIYGRRDGLMRRSDRGGKLQFA